VKFQLHQLACLFAACLSTALLCADARAQFASSGQILPAERQTTEAPRTVAAREYRDAYCAVWTDGCTTCERKSANDQPACREAAGQTPSCQKHRVACRAILPTIGRVCLQYSDGCNTCTGGTCTLLSCSGVSLSSKPRKVFTPDFTCRQPRRAQYDDPRLLRADLQGHWQLSDERSRSCDLFIRHNVSASPSCSAIHPALAEVRTVQVDGTMLRLVDRTNRPLLAFDISNLDSPKGVEDAVPYRLIRMK